MRGRLLAAGLLLAAFCARGAADGPAPDASAGGTADGWLEVARERTTLRHAYVLGESGDGASGALRVVLSDRPLSEAARGGAEVRDALAAADEARSIVAVIPEAGEIEIYFHHPRMPTGVLLRGLARFVPENVTAGRLEGRLVLDAKGTAFEAWFSAPIERVDVAAKRESEPVPERRVLPLDEAIRSGDEEELELALERAGALDQAAGSSGMSALSVAVDAGNLAAVKRLLEAGAAVDWRADRASMTALMHAAGKEDSAIVEALLAAGANPKLRTSSGFTALTNAIFAGRIENVRRLIAAGADVARDRDALLKLAREKGFAEIAVLLEEAPAAPPGAQP
jgi:hypothetical protein